MRVNTPTTNSQAPHSELSSVPRARGGNADCKDSLKLSTNPLSQLSDETIESEISHLTWAVLDGRATQEERKRLSELVSVQHQRRELPSK